MDCPIEVMFGVLLSLAKEDLDPRIRRNIEGFAEFRWAQIRKAVYSE
jgi:hypothetical protein